MLLLLFPAQQKIGKMIGAIRKKAVKVSGKRVQLVQEILVCVCARVCVCV